MPPKPDRPSQGLRHELREITVRGLQAWRLVPARQRWALAGAVAVMAVTSAAATAIPYSIGRLVDSISLGVKNHIPRSNLTRVAVFYLSIVGVCYLIREIFNVLRRYLVNDTCARIDKDLCVQVVGHLMKVDLSSLAHEQVGALHGRIHRSVEGCVRFLRLTFLDMLPELLIGGFALMVTLSLQPWVALAMAGVIPLSLGLTIWQLITQRGVRVDLLRSRELMDGTVVEQLTGLDYVRAANTHRQEVLRVEHAAEGRRAKEVRHHFEMSLFGCGKALNEGFFHLLVVAFTTGLFLYGRLEAGDILMFSILFLNVMAPLNAVHRFIDEAHESSIRIADLLDMMAVPEDRSFHPVHPRNPDLSVGSPIYTAEDLRVEYKTSDGRIKRALDGVSMAIQHGETIGVAGRSGGGKSTWLRSMMRLTHPQGGTATLGGVPMEDVTRESIGDLIGYVGQNPFIFAGTISENIAYGTDGATPERILEAARMACIHDEIAAMPGGYDARVAERGQNLSGGQRQRVALARVFLKNPPILILDEGTSALDNISERKVQRAIDAARADRTVILVAHRLSTLLDTDRIFVFDDGRIAEEGTYDDLVRRGGVFAELVHSAIGAPPPVAAPAPMPAAEPEPEPPIYVDAPNPVMADGVPVGV